MSIAQARYAIDREDVTEVIKVFNEIILLTAQVDFEMKLPSSAPVAVGSLTKEQFDAQLQKSIDDIARGRVLSADAVEAEIRELYSE